MQDLRISDYFVKLDRTLNSMSDRGYRACRLNHELDFWERKGRALTAWLDNGLTTANPAWPGARPEDISEIVGGLYNRLTILRTEIKAGSAAKPHVSIVQAH